MSKIFSYLTVLIMLCHSANTFVDACTVNSSIVQTVTFGAVNVQRDLPVGSEIARVNVPSSASVSAFSSQGPQYCEAKVIMDYLGAVLTSISGVYKTNLDGVGIKAYGFPGGWSIKSPAAGINAFYYPSGYYVSLVKTGPITSGALSVGGIGHGWFGDASKVFIQISLGEKSAINVLSCSLNSQVIKFNLGDINASEFSDHSGFTPARRDTQNLGLNCEPHANINIELLGAKNPDALADPSVLALTGQGNADAADGVGIQLLYSNELLKLNNRIVLKQSSGGQETFPLTARYYQTKNSVKPGHASATATLNITYQ